MNDVAEPPVVFALAPCRGLVATIAGLERGRAALGRFPNGELHARVETPVADRACSIVGSISPPDTRIARLTLLAHSLRRAGARSMTAILPYLGYARQDRADPDEGLGLAWAGALLQAATVDRVVTIDVHSAAAAEILGIPLTSLAPTPVLAPALPADWTGPDVTFVAPDQGAADRCRSLADAVGNPRPIAVLSKQRLPTGVVHSELVGEVEGRVVVVDDILDTGATLLSGCRLLAARGVAEIGVVVTHGVLTGSEWLKLWSVGVRRLWTTDSIPSRRARSGGAEIVSLAPLLASLLSDLHGSSTR